MPWKKFWSGIYVLHYSQFRIFLLQRSRQFQFFLLASHHTLSFTSFFSVIESLDRVRYQDSQSTSSLQSTCPAALTYVTVNPLKPDLNPSAQRCLTRYFTGDFASWTVHFVNICVKNQQMQQLFFQFINYVWYPLHVSALHCHLQGAFLVPSRTMSLDTTRPSTIFYRLLLNWASLRRY
jgi:hypothetical protein